MPGNRSGRATSPLTSRGHARGHRHDLARLHDPARTDGRPRRVPRWHARRYRPIPLPPLDVDDRESLLGGGSVHRARVAGAGRRTSADRRRRPPRWPERPHASAVAPRGAAQGRCRTLGTHVPSPRGRILSGAHQAGVGQHLEGLQARGEARNRTDPRSARAILGLRGADPNLSLWPMTAGRSSGRNVEGSNAAGSIGPLAAGATSRCVFDGYLPTV